MYDKLIYRLENNMIDEDFSNAIYDFVASKAKDEMNTVVCSLRYIYSFTCNWIYNKYYEIDSINTYLFESMWNLKDVLYMNDSLKKKIDKDTMEWCYNKELKTYINNGNIPSIYNVKEFDPFDIDKLYDYKYLYSILYQYADDSIKIQLNKYTYWR